MTTLKLCYPENESLGDHFSERQGLMWYCYEVGPFGDVPEARFLTVQKAAEWLRSKRDHPTKAEETYEG